MTNTPHPPNAPEPYGQNQPNTPPPASQQPPAQEPQNFGWDGPMPQPPQAAPNPYGAQSAGWGNYSADSIPTTPPKRPASVVFASIAAWLWAALTIVGAIVVIAASGSVSDQELRQALGPEVFMEAAKQGLSEEQFISSVKAMVPLIGVFLAVVGVFALIAGILAFRGSNGWRIFGIVGASITLALTIIGSLSAPSWGMLTVVLPLISIICWAVAGGWYRAVRDYKRMSLYRR